MSTRGIPGSGESKSIVNATNLNDLEVPDFPRASDSLRSQMAAYFNITSPNEEDFKMIDGMIYQMEMSAYNYLKDVFEKSRERRKEEFREEQKSKRS